MFKPAIVAVGYNRPDGIKRLLESIGNACYLVDNIPLIISIDESNKSNDVEKVAQDFFWQYGKKEIRRFSKRQGLRNHIIQCGDLSEKYGGVIILEDDLIVAEDFYTYVCKAHETYGSEQEICGVALYSYSYNVFTHYVFTPTPSVNDVFLGRMVVTWGQSWTFEQWRRFKKWYLEHEGKLSKINHNLPQAISTWTRSWGRYFAFYMEENKLSYVYPYVARSTCFSDFGEHNKSKYPLTYVQVPLMHGFPEYRFPPVFQLEKFDAFFEKILDDHDVIANVPGNQICVDLNNMKVFAEDKPYLLTNEKLPLKVVASFALTMRPIIENALKNIKGKEIFLYEINKDSKQIRKWKRRRPSFPANLCRLKYEFHDISWRMLIFYTPRELISRLMDFLSFR